MLMDRYSTVIIIPSSIRYSEISMEICNTSLFPVPLIFSKQSSYLFADGLPLIAFPMWKSIFLTQLLEIAQYVPASWSWIKKCFLLNENHKNLASESVCLSLNSPAYNFDQESASQDQKWTKSTQILLLIQIPYTLNLLANYHGKPYFLVRNCQIRLVT